MPPSTDEQERDLDDISPHVRIRINQRKKRDWLEYADEHNLSLTDLIKDSVENTISDEWVVASEAEPDIDLGELDVGGIDEDIEEVKSMLEAFETQLDNLTVENTSGDELLERSELLPLAERVQDKLPEVSDGDSLIELGKNVMQLHEHQIPWYTGRAIDIANAIDEPESHVRQALIWMESEQQVSNVASIIHDGERRWYEVNPRKTVDQALEQISEEELPDDAELDFSTAGELEDTDGEQ